MGKQALCCSKDNNAKSLENPMDELQKNPKIQKPKKIGQSESIGTNKGSVNRS